MEAQLCGRGVQAHFWKPTLEMQLRGSYRKRSYRLELEPSPQTGAT